MTDFAQLKHDGCTVSSETRDMSMNISAPDNVVAIIVDISAPGGKIVIWRHAPPPAPWGVEIVREKAALGEPQLLIWPWRHEWKFYAVGWIKIRYLVKPSTVT
jgi:hypothetical protein